MNTKVRFNKVEEGIEAIRNGEMVIVVDDEDRENEGDLICAAEKITPELINFMAVHARGLICMPITPERASQLMLPPMVNENESTTFIDFEQDRWYRIRLRVTAARIDVWIDVWISALVYLEPSFYHVLFN